MNKSHSLRHAQMMQYCFRPALVAALGLLLCANQTEQIEELEQQTATLPVVSENAALVEAEIETTTAKIVLPFNTPIMVMLNEELSSKFAKPGDEFSVTVLDDVKIDETVVIPSGSQGFGEVRFANDNGGFGRAGLLDVTLRHIELGDHKIPLRGRFRQEGKNNNGATIATWVAVGVFSGFIKGKEGVLLKGQELKGRTASEFIFEPNSLASTNQTEFENTFVASSETEATQAEKQSSETDILEASEKQEMAAKISDEIQQQNNLTTEGENIDE